MKIISFLFPVFLLLFSCSNPSNKGSYTFEVRKSVRGFYSKLSQKIIETEEREFTHFLSRRNSEKCAAILSFSKTNIETARIPIQKNNFFISNFNKCEAVQKDDKIEIRFYNFPAPSGNHYFVIKFVDENFYEIKIKINENFEPCGLPRNPVWMKNKILHSDLILDKKSYEVGDTIWGKLHVVSEVESKFNGSPYTEISKGGFKTIIRDLSQKCQY